jgi:lycopene beta-cyclase
MTGFDYVLVGGGLQGGLIALALRARQPDATVALVERDDRLGGNHTWCFHRHDLSQRARTWLEPLVVHRWPGYRVIFPERERTIDQEYSCITSARFHAVVSSALHDHAGSEVLLRTEVTGLGPDRVHLRGGGDLAGRVVVDARGPTRPRGPARAGFQKFLGLEMLLDGPHGLDRPIVMDATVDQSEGYHFVYVLPLGHRSVLVEDTYFHESPVLHADDLRAEVHAYVRRRGWTVAGIEREESGVLPMPWSESFRLPASGPLVAGYRGGWFHPATGYSFPVALRLAELIAGRRPTELFGPELTRFARRHRGQVLFAQLLNRFLFRWYPPRTRRSIFERFYGLPDKTIGNFYALGLRWRDGLRLLVGRPPRGLSLRHRLRSALR